MSRRDELGGKFPDVPGQLSLVMFCEAHGTNVIATHRVEFSTADPFYVCRSCAGDAADRGLTVRLLGEEEGA